MQARPLLHEGKTEALVDPRITSGYDAEQVKYLEDLAEEYGLLKTGGSDFHGGNKPHISLGTGIHGELDVPYAWLERLHEEAEKMHKK
jgi:hypothetical protein